MVSKYRVGKWVRARQNGSQTRKRGGSEESRAVRNGLNSMAHLPPWAQEMDVWTWAVARGNVLVKALTRLWGTVLMSAAPVATKGHAETVVWANT